MLFLIIFLLSLLLSLPSEAFCPDYPSYESCQNYFDDDFLEEADGDCFAKKLRNWLNAPKTREQNFN